MNFNSIVPWLPVVAVLLHVIEEFAWPGGFADWYRWYAPDRAASITTPWLVGINALYVAMAVFAGALFPRPYGVAFWLVVASIAAANAIFHLRATIRMRTYSPGVVTGLLFYLPLAVYGFYSFSIHGLASWSTVLQAAAIGPAFHFYSAYRHRRRVAALKST